MLHSPFCPDHSVAPTETRVRRRLSASCLTPICALLLFVASAWSLEAHGQSNNQRAWPGDDFPLTAYFRKIPEVSPTIQSKAYKLWRRGRVGTALKHLTRAARSLPTKKRDAVMLAIAHQAMSFADAPRALPLYRRLLASKHQAVAANARLMLARYRLMQYSPKAAHRLMKSWPSRAPKGLAKRRWLAGWLIRAAAAERSRKWVSAIKAYRFLIKRQAVIAPYAAQRHLVLLMRQKRYTQVDTFGKRYLRKWPKGRRASSYRRQIARAYSRRGKYKRALRQFRRLARAGSTSARLDAIRCQLKLGQRKAAIASLLRLLRRKPGGWVAHSAARMLRKLGYRTTLPSIQYAMAYHRYRRGQFEPAAAMLLQLLRNVRRRGNAKAKARWEPKALYLRSRALFRIKRYDEARKGLVQMLRRYPRHPRRLAAKLLKIRNRYRKRKDLATALMYEQFARTYRSSSLGRKALWWAAQLIFEHGKTKRATRLFRQYYKRYPRSRRRAEAMLKVALIAYQQKQYARAVQVLRPLRRWGGRTGARALFWTGKSHLKRGDKKRAMQAFRRISPYSESYYAARAQQYTKRRPILARRPASLYQLLSDHKEESRHRNGMRRWIKRQYASTTMDAIAAGLSQSKDYRKAYIFALAGHMRGVRSALRRTMRRPKHPAHIYLLARAWSAFGVPNRTLYTAGRFRRKVPRSKRKGIPFRALLRLLYPVPYPAIYMRYGKKYQIAPLLLVGLTRQESLFNPMIVSGAGARGIAQIMPKEGRKMARKWKIRGYRLKHLFRPQLNLRMGFHHFREYLNRHQGHVALTLAAYNAGPGALKRWLKAHKGLQKRDIEAFIEYGIGYRETRMYVRYCLRWYNMYRFAFGAS